MEGMLKAASHTTGLIAHSLLLSFLNNILERLPERPGRITIGLRHAGGAVLGAQPAKE